MEEEDPPEEAAHVNLVTLVFDQLGPDGRRIAREAGLALAGITDREDLLVSVFKIRETLGLVQQFTADRERVREAVVEATGAVNTQYSDATDELVDAVDRDRIAQERLDQLEVAGPEGVAQAAALGQQAALARMAVDSLRLTQTLQREQQGNASLYSLLALSRQQQRLAGRKTILYFSEGLQVPPSLEHVLRQAISEANQANVSIYAIDARGLTVAPRMDATRETLRQSRIALERQANGGASARCPRRRSWPWTPRRTPCGWTCRGPSPTWPTAPAARSSPTPTGSARPSSGQWATCAATTSWCTRPPTPPTTGPSARSMWRSRARTPGSSPGAATSPCPRGRAPRTSPTRWTC